MLFFSNALILFCGLAAAAPSWHIAPRQTGGICGSTQTITQTVKAGDTLSKIAPKFNSGICDIAKLSNLTNVNALSIGQNLTIPTNCTTPDNTSCLSSGAAAAPVNQTCVVGPPSAYNVLFDDTFQKIASNFGLTEAALQKANPNVTASAIKENQILQIPVCPNSQCTVQTHIVQSGDLFVDLANKNGATVGQVLGLNAGINRFNLEVGQQIMIATKCGNATSS